MSSDPGFTVEWTVPTDEDEWGDGAPTAGARSGSAERESAAVAAGRDCDRSSDRDPEDLPPAPVLAARVDHLRSEREARERELDAVRARYETILADRNAEIRALRERESALARLRRWLAESL